MENDIIFYGIPRDKSDCYKYAHKTCDGWEIIWYNSFDNVEARIPLSIDDLNKLI